MAKRGGFMGGGMPGGMGNLLKQAQKMQKQMQDATEELANKEYKASTGGGMVEATVNGENELLSLSIKEEAVDPDDIEMLQDMIIAAVNDANAQAKKDKQEVMSSFTGGMPGGLPF